MSARGITVVSASAGSGKTYRLTQEVTRALEGTPESPAIALEGLVAVTFTRKAHAELAARIRHKLGAMGRYEDAMRLPLAYLGTVHAACLRLLQEFALDAGVSPNVDVVAESQSRLLRQALEAALAPEARMRLQELTARVELRLDNKTKRYDWLTPVADIMDLARSNRIAPEQLPAMAERSVAGLLDLLPKPPLSDAAGEALDVSLAKEIERALHLFEKKKDKTKTTADAIALIEDVDRRRRDGEMKWSDWAKLATVSPSKGNHDCVEQLREVAKEYERHPRLRADLRELTFAIFDAARVGLIAYAEWKQRRRVVDYVDMLDRALDLVDHPSVRAELARRLELVVVDEFQDTSPIQLALFVRMHALAKRSVWVGDRKQCIFEYAGADPLLMDDVAAWVEKTGGARDKLGKNYRSREELVRLSNVLFADGLARHGFSPEEVTVEPTRVPVDGLPPLGVWWMETTKNEQDAEAIAEGVRLTLASPESTRVVDRVTSERRAVRPGDIAVLVTTNACARQVADALHKRGIRAAIARAGLLSTPEGTLVDAALRWTLDEGDTLAAANIDALTGFDGKSADAWLEGRLRAVAADAAARAEAVQVAAGEGRVGEGTAPTARVAATGWRAALVPVRDQTSVMSPSEALDAVLDALDAVHLCARWPDAPQRIANVDALRALASTYEKRCEQEREAATIAGLLRYFDDLREEKLVRDEMLASDDQHVPTDEGAVVVCTYHKSKGLEWPVVVLANLDKAERRTAFDVASESEAKDFDPERPLEGRWIRYWPWPFGATKVVPLADAAAQSEVGKAVAAREDKERARLLYVGFTRARDHLVLAVRQQANGKAKSEWLDVLRDAEGEPLVELPVVAEDASVVTTRVAKTVELQTRVLRVGAEMAERAGEPAEDAISATTVRWFVRGAAAQNMPRPRPAYWITPSAVETPAQKDGVEAPSPVRAIERLPSAILVDGKGYDYDVLGNAVHAFLAADVEGLAGDERLARATRLLAGAGLSGHVRAESLLRAGDELRAWVSKKWPDAKWHREVAVEAVEVIDAAERQVSGVVDLLLETADGFVVIDHKTFPGATDAALRARAVESAAQLGTYASVIERRADRACERWIHLPVAGRTVKIL